MTTKWKKEIAELWDGRCVYMVDGQYVRDNVYADFTEGGNHEADPEFVPKSEIWVEQLQTADDLVESLVHEVVESTLMKYGIKAKYDAAHDATNTVSSAVRKVRRANCGKDAVAKLNRLTLYPEKDVKMAPRGEQKASLKDLL